LFGGKQVLPFARAFFFQTTGRLIAPTNPEHLSGYGLIHHKTHRILYTALSFSASGDIRAIDEAA
jgi:hypothetical protein